MHQKLTFPPSAGDIIMADLDPVFGDVQKEKRPYLVVSVEPFNQYFGLCMICPITNGVGANGEALADSPFFVDLVSKKGKARVTGKVIANQYQTIDWRADEYGCSFRSVAKAEVLSEVKEALKKIVGL